MVIEFHVDMYYYLEKALRAYPIDVLDSKSNTKAIDRVQAEIATNVNFFQIGFCNGRDMLVFKKKKNTSSVFVSLEPFCDLRDPKNEKLLTYRPSLFGKPDYLRWFKKYKVKKKKRKKEKSWELNMHDRISILVQMLVIFTF